MRRPPPPEHERARLALQIEPEHRRQHLPEVIECFVNSLDAHAAFLNEFGLSARTHPHIRLSSNWDAPFSE